MTSNDLVCLNDLANVPAGYVVWQQMGDATIFTARQHSLLCRALY